MESQTQAGVTIFTREQHMECLRLLDRVRDAWVRLFDADARFSAAVCGELLSYLWAEAGSARKTEALRSVKSLKGPIRVATSEALEHRWRYPARPGDLTIRPVSTTV